ncbi:MAG: HigA family addiction module antidote protein [Gammaproteobacteria bacterium]|nr:HigA family addiction module antidote protein [Gammaproteobacteria bacterium]
MSSLRSKKRKPTHPGAILREDVLPSLNISQGELADRLGVSRRTVSQILHEHRPLTPDMAIRLAHFLGTTPESWLNMQQALDVWELERKNARVYEQIKKVA